MSDGFDRFDENERNRHRRRGRGRGHNKHVIFENPAIVTEMRDGKEVVIIDAKDYNKQFKQKRVSYKQRTLEENDIDLKHISCIQIKKREGTYSFKITNIPSVEELKRLIVLQGSY